MQIVWGDADPALNEAMAVWIQRRVGFEHPFRPPYRTMGVFEDGALVGALIFEKHMPDEGTVEVGGAAVSPRWYTRKVIDALAWHVFDRLGCQMAVFRTGENNHRVRRIMERAGFESVTIPRLRGRHEAEIVFTMTDDNWRTNRLRRDRTSHGQQTASPA